MKLSVIIPVFNEEATIEEVINRVNKVNVEKEVIVVDDGSTDDTVRVFRKHEVTTLYVSPVNIGKGVAVRIALTFVTGDVVVIQDADIELDPQEYHLLLDKIKAGADVVYGSRFLKPNPNIPKITHLANWFLTMLTNVLYGSNLTDMETGYKMFRAEAARRLNLKCIGFEFEPEITTQFLKLGYEIAEVPISYNPRTSDEGKKIAWRDGLLAVYYLFLYRLAKKGKK